MLEKYSCLYNYSLSEYSRKDIIEKARNDIAHLMNWTDIYANISVLIKIILINTIIPFVTEKQHVALTLFLKRT